MKKSFIFLKKIYFVISISLIVNVPANVAMDVACGVTRTGGAKKGTRREGMLAVLPQPLHGAEGDFLSVVACADCTESCSSLSVDISIEEVPQEEFCEAWIFARDALNELIHLIASVEHAYWKRNLEILKACSWPVFPTSSQSVKKFRDDLRLLHEHYFALRALYVQGITFAKALGMGTSSSLGMLHSEDFELLKGSVYKDFFSYERFERFSTVGCEHKIVYKAGDENTLSLLLQVLRDFYVKHACACAISTRMSL